MKKAQTGVERCSVCDLPWNDEEKSKQSQAITAEGAEWFACFCYAKVCKEKVRRKHCRRLTGSKPPCCEGGLHRCCMPESWRKKTHLPSDWCCTEAAKIAKSEAAAAKRKVPVRTQTTQPAVVVHGVGESAETARVFTCRVCLEEYRDSGQEDDESLYFTCSCDCRKCGGENAACRYGFHAKCAPESVKNRRGECEAWCCDGEHCCVLLKGAGSSQIL